MSALLLGFATMFEKSLRLLFLYTVASGWWGLWFAMKS